MKSQFIGYYQPTAEEFRILWEKATFIVDANVLLNLYRYPLSARKELLNLLNRLSTRLWLPYHAALEFQRNRPKVISEQKSSFRDVRKSIDSAIGQLTGELTKLKRRHSLIDPDVFLSAIQPVVDAQRKSLDELEKAQGNAFDSDPLRDTIDSLFRGRVGDAPSQEFINKILKEGEHRYKFNMPPGFSDAKKGESLFSEYSYNDVYYSTQFGDLIIWKQILQKAEETQDGFFIFLTDDEKPDWWWTINSQGEKKLGPRPELISEIMTVGKARSFYMYNSENFLRYGKEYLNIDVSAESMDQVAEVTHKYSDPSDETEVNSMEDIPIGRIIKAVEIWAKAKDDAIEVERSYCEDEIGIDFVTISDFCEVGYVIIYAAALRRLRASLFKELERERKGRKSDKINVVIIFRTKKNFPAILARANTMIADLRDTISATVGYISQTPDGKIRFAEVAPSIANLI